MSNAKSRKRNKVYKESNLPIFIIDAKKKSKRKYFELPFFVNFSDDSTEEGIEEYWKAYHKQHSKLKKNRKYSRQSKGIQKPYVMHASIKNLRDCVY